MNAIQYIKIFLSKTGEKSLSKNSVKYMYQPNVIKLKSIKKDREILKNSIHNTIK